jgi:AcrR family transcriptional regulator
VSPKRCQLPTARNYPRVTADQIQILVIGQAAMSVLSPEQRTQRILDVAGELVLRWGYKRVSIEEIARHAGIGKGTVYLHFHSRTWLFMAVLMRESLALIDELIAAIHTDPAALLPAEQTRLTYLAVMRRPLLRAMFERDSELLGELAHEAAVHPLQSLKITFSEEWFALLRDHRLMRTEMDIGTQCYICQAVQTGFYLSGQDQPVEWVAEALSHTIRSALQSPGPADPAALAALAPTVISMYERFQASLVALIGDRDASPQSEPA